MALSSSRTTTESSEVETETRPPKKTVPASGQTNPRAGAEAEKSEIRADPRDLRCDAATPSAASRQSIVGSAGRAAARRRRRGQRAVKGNGPTEGESPGGNREDREDQSLVAGRLLYLVSGESRETCTLPSFCFTQPKVTKLVTDLPPPRWCTDASRACTRYTGTSSMRPRGGPCDTACTARRSTRRQHAAIGGAEGSMSWGHVLEQPRTQPPRRITPVRRRREHVRTWLGARG